jgi:large subunit ribosomal protein L4
MSKAVAYSKTGTKKEADVTLAKNIFDVEANHDLVGLAYNAYLANGRGANATTLTRGLVRGGGRKPWRQKGTGRARVGSIRVPNWKGGGVVFGPSGNENYSINLSVKTKRTAIRQALSLQASDKKIVVIEDFVATDGKSKTAASLLSKLKLDGNLLLVVAEKTPEIIRATSNLAGLTVVSAKYLNVFIVMNADAIVMTSAALTAIDSWLGDAK